jgi:hypothetical protein
MMIFIDLVQAGSGISDMHEILIGGHPSSIIYYEAHLRCLWKRDATASLKE